jgi:hypothetical protein
LPRPQQQWQARIQHLLLPLLLVVVTRRVQQGRAGPLVQQAAMFRLGSLAALPQGPLSSSRVCLCTQDCRVQQQQALGLTVLQLQLRRITVGCAHMRCSCTWVGARTAARCMLQELLLLEPLLGLAQHSLM